MSLIPIVIDCLCPADLARAFHFKIDAKLCSSARLFNPHKQKPRASPGGLLSKCWILRLRLTASARQTEAGRRRADPVVRPAAG